MFKQKFIVFILMLVIFSCKESDDNGFTEEPPPPQSSEKQITSWIIDASLNGLSTDIKADINEEAKTISLKSKVPVGKNLIATFEAKGSVYIGTVKQQSGQTANDFCKDISYKVIAEDGSSIIYKLIADPDNEGLSLKNFKLKLTQDGSENIIEGGYNENETTISLRARYTVWIDNIEKAIATFESEGDVYVNNLKQESGVTTNDFRKELIYEVRADGYPTRKYKVVLESAQSTGIPVLKIDVAGGEKIEDKINYKPSQIHIFDPEKPPHNISKQPAGVRGRGNSTWELYAKKPYRIKFDEKTSLFGLKEAKSWVLRANYQDPTFIMNTVAFELGHRLNLEYTNTSNHVELFLNGEHKGSYLLTEQVQVNKRRINIDEKNGFLIELDDYYDEEFKFRSSTLDLPVNIKSPEEISSESELDFVKKAFNDLENALFDKSFPNNNYRELIDINSVINYLLVNEIVYNGEIAHPKSLYMYKDVNKKIHMGPLWDFDWGFCHVEDGNKYFMEVGERLFHRNSVGDAGKLFARFFEDPQFRQEYKNRWNEIKPLAYSMDGFITKYGVYLRKSAQANMRIWQSQYYKHDFDEEIEKMKTWLQKRITFWIQPSTPIKNDINRKS